MINAQEARIPSSLACAERGLRQLPLNRQFELLDQAGLRFLEIGLGAQHPGQVPMKSSDERIDTLNTLSQKFSIQIPFVGIEANLTQDIESALPTLLNEVKEGLQTASRIGATTANLSLTATPTVEVSESRWTSFTSAIRELGSVAEKLHLQINLMTQGWVETQKPDGLFMVETIMTNRDSLKKLIPDLPTNVQIGYEPGMWKAVNPSDLRFGRDSIQDRIGILVLQDWEPRDRLIREAVIGSDDFDYRPLIRNLSPEVPLLLSIPSHTDPAKALEQSLTYLNRISQSEN